MTAPGADAAQRVAEPRPEGVQRSVGELISEVTKDLSTLVNQEIELAKTELKLEAGKVGKTAGAFGGAAVTGYFALVFLSWTVVFALHALFDSYTWAALTVGLLYLIAAGVLALRGKKTAQSINPKPDVTVQTLKEDAQWAKTRKS